MDATGFVTLTPAGRPVQIEWARIDAPAGAPARAPLVFLHEGLGSLSLWRDFPARLCAALGRAGWVYSRPGYGRSTPRPPDKRWSPDFMHRQARELLPALLDALGVAGPCVLFGHSDGGSIALLHAAAYPERVAALVVAAPHLFVEDLTVESIRQARVAYTTTDLRARLARHHADPDSAFFGWNDIWLDPAFRDWNLETEVARITGPVLAVQGEDDEYGTMAQIERIAALRPQQPTELLKLAACGHSPHRDQPQALIEATRAFLQRHDDRRPED
ncbi:alpha/beta hydrolase fold protein [Sphaerotilus natans subsp. natans DSM 6575]|uniref:Alpha/beta hydrolase fold protein n=1 Tax=Sphaerotilus natans subsp. natans DSM 6575 TaxID=1286631 RepID=A0A059KLD6_9BURK|nr:alpha/beta hydrolase [Sphaerotilus natans]KDB52276.1 alpha/beta hydrolase fold protein [Sphaerotilus natans subsp. natans DSM 6575]SIR87601.1 Pimeloyl-ACP methyl ester carboxylesterase [Sphaerotilus natans]